MDSSDLDMVVAGTESAVLMVESEANELTEDQMLGAVLFAHQEMQVVINAIKEFKDAVGNQEWSWETPQVDNSLKESVDNSFSDQIKEAYKIVDKRQRQESLNRLRETAKEQLTEEGFEDENVLNVFASLEKRIVRKSIVEGNVRIDGRDNRTVRKIEVEVGLLPESPWLCFVYARRNPSSSYDYLRIHPRCRNN